MLLNKDEILNIEDCNFVDLEIPEWKGSVRISTMTGTARDRFESNLMTKSGKINHDNVRAKLVAACLVDDKNELLFSEKDIVALGKKSCKTLNKIFEVAQKINGIGDEEVEDLAKN